LTVSLGEWEKISHVMTQTRVGEGRATQNHVMHQGGEKEATRGDLFGKAVSQLHRRGSRLRNGDGHTLVVRLSWRRG